MHDKERYLAFEYVWCWNPQFVIPGLFSPMSGRKGQFCRVLARGKRNTALLEFEDGFQVYTSRNGLKRHKP